MVVVRTNQMPRTSASSKVGKGRERGRKNGSSSSRRSADTIERLKMYANGKPIRDKKGKVIGGTYMLETRAGDREINASSGRIQPDRRWFGNTRVVAPNELDQFRKEMLEATSDPYSVVLKRKKIPMGLLQDAADYVHDSSSANTTATTTINNKKALLEQEPFERSFGSKSNRKRVKLDQLLIPRSASKIVKKDKKIKGGHAQLVSKSGVHEDNEDGDNADTNNEDSNDENKAYSALLGAAQKSHEAYDNINKADGIVPWGRDSQTLNDGGVHGKEGVDWRHEVKDDLFNKGQSKRIWGEFFKVVDCSDIILHVIDVRNVPGTRCTMIEKYVDAEAKHKHLVFVLNKVDLVPNWVVKRWIGELCSIRPTIAFHASMRHAFGKGALISLLRQYGTLMQDKKQISVGVVGYPNVGKSSVINTLISKKSCKVAPIPGETKIWQYITLFRRISLIDCPGVVVDTAGDTEADSVLKGVIRAERLECPEDFIQPIIDRVKREHINAQYKLDVASASIGKGKNKKQNDKCNDYNWKTDIQLMETIANKCGRLRKGGEPCLRSASIMIINDYQRGRLPHYVSPPQLKSTGDDNNEDNNDDKNLTNTISDEGIKQNLNLVGQEHMEKVVVDDDDVQGTSVVNEEKLSGKNKKEKKNGKLKKENNVEKRRKGERAGKEEKSKDDQKPIKADKKTDKSHQQDNNENTSNLIGRGDWDD